MEKIPKHRGFLHHERRELPLRKVSERIKDFREVSILSKPEEIRDQAARCMDCGVPFCQSGCPIGNAIPDWNDLVLNNQWEGAYKALSRTNNFPEFTGRICPAPCEAACVLSLNNKPVSIENIERSIIETAFERGFIRANPPLKRTGKKVAIVGSGPAGLTAADQLNQAGHSVVVYERHNKVGGLLRYGIPDFKLEKNVIDRRIALLEEEGILFKTGVEVGLDVTTEELDEGYDAIILCCGASQARDLPISGRDLQGIHFAWDFLNKQNQLIAGEIPSIPEPYSVANRNVVVIGGGDTGSDCIGTSVRQGAKSIIQLEVLPRPELERSVDQPWPYYPMILKVTTSHEEGAGRHWSIMTKRFTGTYGHVSGLETVEVKRDNNGQFQEIPNSSKMWPAERILLAIGYTGPEKSVFENLKIESPKSHRRDFSDLQIPNSKYYYAGDMRRGQSLVVWAIREGREVAQKVNGYLTHCEIEKGIGTEDLPRL